MHFALALQLPLPTNIPPDVILACLTFQKVLRIIYTRGRSLSVYDESRNQKLHGCVYTECGMLSSIVISDGIVMRQAEENFDVVSKPSSDTCMRIARPHQYAAAGPE